MILKFVRRVIKRKGRRDLLSTRPAGDARRAQLGGRELSRGAPDRQVSLSPAAVPPAPGRLLDAGIGVSRDWLTQLVHRTARLLEPIYEAQRASILESAVVAMDESPIIAGQRERGRLQTTFFWPVYGDRSGERFRDARSMLEPRETDIRGRWDGGARARGDRGRLHPCAVR